MPKIPAVLSLAVVAVLLTGCGVVSEPAAEEPASSAPSASQSSSSSPSASPSPAETTDAPAVEETPQPEAATEAPQTTPPVNTTPVEPLPSVPDDPIVPTPHGEPAPDSPPGSVITPTEEWGAATITAYPGDTFTIVGDGYEPGEQLRVGFGPAQTDSSIIGDPFTFADANGSFIYVITLPLEIEIRTFVAAISKPDFSERRWAVVEVLAP